MWTKIVLFCYILLSLAIKSGEFSHPRRAFKGGDIIVGALLPIHLKNGSRTCGNFNEGGFGLSQALIFAVKEINRDSDLLSNITLGYDIRDYCSSPALAMKFTYELLQNSSIHIPAIIGPIDSGTALLVGSLLQAVNVPAISPTATSEELRQPLYRSFFRTISPDGSQANAMVEIIEQFNWKYIAVIAIDNSYGRNGVRALEKESVIRGTFCLAVKEYLPSTGHIGIIARIVEKLKSLNNIRVFVLWSNRNGAWRFLKQAREQKLLGKTWILSEAMTKDYEAFIKRYSDVVSGSIGISLFRYNLTPSRSQNITTDPWWNDFWMLQHKCKSTISHADFFRCLESVSVHKDWFSEINQAYVPYMKDAVYAIAFALDTMYKCKEPYGLLSGGKCPQTRPRVAPKDLLIYLRNVSFHGITGNIAFDKYGDPPPSDYEIVNFQSYIENGTQNSKLVRVGTWSKKKLTLNESLVKWVIPGNVPVSICTHKCKPGTMQTRTIACCWECITCPANTVSKSYASSNCSQCPRDQKSNQDRTQCIDLPVNNFAWSDAWSIVCISFAFLGIALCILAISIFIKYKNTPLVKGSSFELSVTLLMFIAVHFALPPFYFGQPSDVVCKVREPLRYASLTGCVSILLLKTLRLVSAFEVVSLADWFKNNLKSASSQIVTLVVINTVGSIFTLLWLLIDSPYSHREIIERKNIFITCKPYKSDTGRVIQGLVLTYLIVLSLLCTYYATKARTLPGNFCETRFIGFSMYTFLLSWITYYSVEFSLENPYVAIVASSTILMSSYAILCFMFAPKLYIILFLPHKNTPECIKSGVTRYTFDNCRSRVGEGMAGISAAVIPNVEAFGQVAENAQ